jgi:hypothetical protein
LISIAGGFVHVSGHNTRLDTHNMEAQVFETKVIKHFDNTRLVPGYANMSGIGAKCAKPDVMLKMIAFGVVQGITA